MEPVPSPKFQKTHKGTAFPGGTENVTPRGAGPDNGTAIGVSGGGPTGMAYAIPVTETSSTTETTIASVFNRYPLFTGFAPGQYKGAAIASL